MELIKDEIYKKATEFVDNFQNFFKDANLTDSKKHLLRFAFPEGAKLFYDEGYERGKRQKMSEFRDALELDNWIETREFDKKTYGERD